MYKYVSYLDSKYAGDYYVNVIRWEDSDTSQLENYNIRLRDNTKDKLILFDIKDEHMILYDDSNVIYVVQSPNLVKFSIRFDSYRNITSAFINDYDENNKTLIVTLGYSYEDEFIRIYDLNNGELLDSVPFPKYDDVEEGKGVYAHDLKRWGHYLVGMTSVSGEFDAREIWSYNIITNTISFKDATSSNIQYGGETWNLMPPNLLPPSYDSSQPTAYSLLVTSEGMVNDFVMTGIHLDTLEYTSYGQASAGEWHLASACSYFGYSTSAGSNYYVFRNTRARDNWQLRRFEGTTYIDKTLFYQDDVDEIPISVFQFTRTKGGKGDFLWMRVKYGEKYYLQQLTDTFLPVGDTINLTDEGINNVKSVKDIFLSDYLFDSVIENPSIKFELYNGYNNTFKFKLTPNTESFKFKLTKITWNGIELSFTHNESELILYGHESWEINGCYICNVEEEWTSVNSDLSFTKYENIKTIIDYNGDGKNDYDFGIPVPDEYNDTDNLKVYIECRIRDSKTSSMLWNYYDIRIANPVVGGTPWYNYTGTTMNVNWRVKLDSTGEVQQNSSHISNVKNDGWAISGRIYVGISTSHLDSKNRATLILEVQTPSGEWITSDKFQINNYGNEYNYKWRYSGEDDDFIYFKLNGDYTLSEGWYKPNNLYVYDGDERLTTNISNSVGIVDNVAQVKVSKTSSIIENSPNKGYWFHFRGVDYSLSSAPKGFGGVEKCDFYIPLRIKTANITQIEYEVIQINNTINIQNVYFTTNIEVYKDGIKLEGSYNTETGEIKFILPSDTPKEINGYSLNLQYKVFYDDNGEIKSFMQDFTYVAFASYFVEFDPDFKDYYWEQLSPTPADYNFNNGCMITNGDYLYLIASHYNNGYQKSLFRYDIKLNTWIELAPPLYDVYLTRPVVYDNKLYVVGGKTYSDSRILNKVQIYDIATDTWTLGTDCPRVQGPYEYQPIEYKGKIYCFSGNCGEANSIPNKMDIYDIGADTWETIETPYNLKKYSSTCINGKIYICDGTDSNYNYDTTLYIYDIEGNNWTTESMKPISSYGGISGGGTMLNKFVSILGDFREENKNMSFVYDISKEKWMRLVDAPNDLRYSYNNPMCSHNNDEFYVLKYQYFYRLTRDKSTVSYSDAYLYECDGKYYTENENGELIETTTQELNADLFLNEGVGYINSDFIKPNIKVLYFKVENKDEVPQITYSGVYEGTTITMDWDLQSEQGKTFNVLGDIYSDDNVRFLISNNKGQTWLTFDGYEVVNCNIDDIKDNGMTYDVFTSLNPNQLKSFKGDTNTLRLAIYIEQYSVNGKTNIDHIRLRY